MEQKIHIPNEDYVFDSLSLSTPISIFGGAYFTKITNDDGDVFIQTPACTTKSGVVKSGKRMYVDLLFDKTDEKIIEWFENLEERARNLIYEKRDQWFQESIDIDDIESAFTPCVRLYKSGTYYLIRVFLDNPRLYGGTKNVTIYDDRENELSIEDINSESKIICILQIHGIKFTSKSFQIYTQVKQMMVIKNNMFNRCCIVTHGGSSKVNDIEDNDNVIKKTIDTTGEIEDIVIDGGNGLDDVHPSLQSPLRDQDESIIETINVADEDILSHETTGSPVMDLFDTDHSNDEETGVLCVGDDIVIDTYDIENTDKDEDDDGELKEFDMNIDADNMESITLRKPNDVYYDIYREARAKAKESRKMSLQSYIEAQNIKNTHNLDILGESSDDEFEKQIYVSSGFDNEVGVDNSE